MGVSNRKRNAGAAHGGEDHPADRDPDGVRSAPAPEEDGRDHGGRPHRRAAEGATPLLSSLYYSRAYS